MILKRLFPAALVAALLTSTVAVAAPLPTSLPVPGVEWDKRRLERLERNLNRLENTLSRLRPDKAPPVLIAADPETVALQTQVGDLSNRIDDLETALKQLNGELERVDAGRDRAEKDRVQSRAEADALRARVAELESKLAGMEQAQAQALAEATPAQPAADSATDFKAAMQLYSGGDYAGAGKSLSDFLVNWPSSPEAPEAHYRLAETHYIRDDQTSAAAEYVRALKGWPKVKWAPEATAKLSMALSNLGDTKNACAAVAEFDKRYVGVAAPATKSRVAAVKAKAKCAA